MRRLTADTVPYPPGPEIEALSLHLMRRPRSLRTQEYLLLVGELLFVGVYLCLLLAALGLIIFCSLGDFTPLQIIGIAMGVIALGVLTRPLLQRRATPTPSPALEITVEQQPGLFAFLQRVAEDAGADLPRRVFVTADANAAVVLSTSLKNLVRTPPFDLYLGLGLVNALNLSELQAVLAHELGHFSGGPVRAWSRGLEAALDLFPNLLRQALAATRRQLIRERELHADRIAASVAGTPATVNALKQSQAGAAALADAIDDLHRAAEQKLLSDDLFLHHHAAAARLVNFEPDDEPDGLHPTLAERIENVEAAAVDAAIDDRSPWLLVLDAAGLRREVTALALRTWPGVAQGATLTDARLVQARLDAERCDVVYDAKHCGAYDDRMLNLTLRDLDDLLAQVKHEPWNPQRIGRVRATLHDDLAQRVARRGMVARQRRRYLARVTPADGREALERLCDFDARLERFDVWFHAFDRRVALVHFQLSSDLMPRYREVLALQQRAALAVQHAEQVAMFVRLNPRDDHDLFRESVRLFRAAQAALSRLDSTLAMEDLPPGPLQPEWLSRLQKRLQTAVLRTQRAQAERLKELLNQQDVLSVPDAVWQEQ